MAALRLGGDDQTLRLLAMGNGNRSVGQQDDLLLEGILVLG